LALPALAGDVSVSWDASDGATSYTIYYGTSPGDYSGSDPAGTSTTANVAGLAECTVWYFAATASNVAGESGYSNEVSAMPRPIVNGAGPSSGQQGEQLNVTLSGFNYQPGASVQFSNPGVTVNSVNVSSCTEIVVNVTISGSAPTGATDVEVIRADGVRGTGAGIFTVVQATDTTPPVIFSTAATGVTATSATITWTTDEPADSQVFYRRAGETVYLQTALDANLVTDHSVSLQGLVPETTYEYYVSSADGAGNVATSADDTFSTPTSPYDYIGFEAESGDVVSPVRTVSGAGAFAGAWIDTPSGSGSGSQSNPLGTATYGVHIPSTGTWYLWVRLYSPSNQSNSWFETMDAMPRAILSTSQNGVWTWVAGRSFSLSEGLHTLELGGREARARADRVILTNDPSFVATDQPGSDVTPPQGVSQFAAAAGDGAVRLDWTNPQSDYAMTVIRYRTDGRFPMHPADGMPVTRITGTAGSPDMYVHGGLTNGLTYSYGVFVVDSAGNASAASEAEATPTAAPQTPDPPTNLRVVTSN
jgi:hypothetical protein